MRLAIMNENVSSLKFHNEVDMEKFWEAKVKVIAFSFKCSHMLSQFY